MQPLVSMHAVLLLLFFNTSGGDVHGDLRGGGRWIAATMCVLEGILVSRWGSWGGQHLEGSLGGPVQRTVPFLDFSPQNGELINGERLDLG